MQIDPLLDKLRATLPPGYKIQIAGAIEESGKAQESIAANVPLVIFIVFTLLMLQLHSFLAGGAGISHRSHSGSLAPRWRC